MRDASFKVRREVKKIKRYRDRVNWAEEVRRFVEDRIRRLEAEESVRKVIVILKKMPIKVPEGFAVRSVREDRDSG